MDINMKNIFTAEIKLSTGDTLYPTYEYLGRNPDKNCFMVKYVSGGVSFRGDNPYKEWNPEEMRSYAPAMYDRILKDGELG